MVLAFAIILFYPKIVVK